MGHLGGQVLAGVGLGALLCGATNWLFAFLSVLTIPKIAQFMANNDREGAAQYIGQALWIAAVVGFGTLLLVQAQAPALVQSALSHLAPCPSGNCGRA
jgi:Na+-driven multidrug efflux pump